MNKGCVLIVDDDPRILRILALYLEEEGFTVIQAHDGLEAEKLYECWAFDLLITDIFMPGREGLETIKLAKLQNPELKIMAISGGGSRVQSNYLRVAKKLGADTCISKPFEPSRIVEIAITLLS